MLDFAIFAVTFVLALIIAVIYLYPSSKKVTTIPGLAATSETDGNQSDIKKAGSLHEFLLDLHGQYGSIVSFWIGKQFVVSAAAPELFKEQQAIFDRPAPMFQMFEPFIGKNSLQYANKAEGRMRRKLYDRVFTKQALKQYYGCLQKVANELVTKWTTMVSEQHIPLSQYMISTAIKATARIAFGFNISSDDINDIMKSYEISWEDLSDKFLQCWEDMELTMTDGPPAPGGDRDTRFNQALKDFKAVIEKIIEERKKTSEEGGDASSELFVDVLLDSGLEDDVINCDAITYLVGGFHTTGNMLTWALYFLASHPDIQTRVAEEIHEQIGDSDIDHENVDTLIYLWQVMDETLRCAVVAPYAMRYQECDSQLGGHLIPKETPVIHALGVMMHDEKYWPNPNKFDPDRFDSATSSGRPSLAFQPFGFAGKRKCPGHRIAYAETAVIMATILRKFSISLVEGQVITPTFGLVSHPTEEIWIRLEKRE